MKGGGTELTQAGGAALAVPAARDEGAAILGLIDKGLERGFSVEALKELQSMYERASDRNAVRLLNEALAAFKCECPQIRKNREARNADQGGGKLLYTYADLTYIASVVDPILKRHGLTYRFTQGDAPQGMMKIVCTLSHIGGASIEASFTAPITRGTSIMSEPQKYGYNDTFAKRYALVNVLGLTNCDEDNDAAPGGGPAGAITEAQAADLGALLDEVGGDRAKFLAVYGVGKVEDLPASMYAAACRMLRAKGRGR